MTDDDGAGPVPHVRTVASREVYRNNWMTVREDDIEFSDGTRSIYGVVEKADFALVVAEENGGFHLVEQYRYAPGIRSVEFPMGGWAHGKGGTALELAQTELAEETGLTAADWRHVGRLIQSTGYSNQRFDIWLATGLTAGAHNREHTESDMDHRWVSEAEFRRLIRSGLLVDGPSVAAYGMLLLHRDATG